MTHFLQQVIDPVDVVNHHSLFENLGIQHAFLLVAFEALVLHIKQGMKEVMADLCSGL